MLARDGFYLSVHTDLRMKRESGKVECTMKKIMG